MFKLVPVAESGGIDGGLERVLLEVPAPPAVDSGKLRSEDPDVGEPTDPDA